jgi:hypothetical protein
VIEESKRQARNALAEVYFRKTAGEKCILPQKTAFWASGPMWSPWAVPIFKIMPKNQENSRFLDKNGCFMPNHDALDAVTETVAPQRFPSKVSPDSRQKSSKIGTRSSGRFREVIAKKIFAALNRPRMAPTM